MMKKLLVAALVAGILSVAGAAMANEYNYRGPRHPAGRAWGREWGPSVWIEVPLPLPGGGHHMRGDRRFERRIDRRGYEYGRERWHQPRRGHGYFYFGF